MSSKIFDGIRLLKLPNKEIYTCLQARSYHNFSSCTIISSSSLYSKVSRFTLPTSQIQRSFSRSSNHYHVENETPTHDDKQTVTLGSSYIQQRFLYILQQDEHSNSDLDELFQHYKEGVPLSLKGQMRLLDILLKNNKIESAKIILENIDTSDMNKMTQLVEVAKLCARAGSHVALGKLIEKFRTRIKERPKALELLKACIETYIEHGHYEKALEAWFLVTKELVVNFKVHSTFCGTTFQSLIGYILLSSKDLSHFTPTMEKYTKTHQEQYNIVRITLRACNRTGGSRLVHQFFQQIPKTILDAPILKYVLTVYINNNQLDLVSDLMRNYEDMIDPKDLNLARFFRNLKKMTVIGAYREFISLYENDQVPTLEIIKLLMRKLVGSKRGDLVEKVSELYIEKNKSTTLYPYHCILESYITLQNSEAFFNTFRDLYNKNLTPDSYTYYLVMKQFVSNGDLAAGLSLLDYLLDNKIGIKLYHLTLLVQCCARKSDVLSAKKIDDLVERLKLERTPPYYASLMSVYVETNQYKRAMKLFNDYKGIPDVNMYAALIKLYIKSGEYENAKEVYNYVVESQMALSPRFYSVIVDYFCKIGEFSEAENKINEMMPENGDLEDLGAFEVLMKNYIDSEQYTEAITVYNRVLEFGLIPSVGVYAYLMESLVKLSYINNDNYSRPSEIAEGLISSHEKRIANKPGKFMSFRVIKPLVNYLARFYNPSDAMALLEKFKSVNPGMNFARNISILRQELIIHGESKDWERFNAILQNYLEEIKSRMVRGKRIWKARDVLVPIIGYQIEYATLNDEQVKIRDLVVGFIFEQKFAVSNKNMNEIAILLLSDTRTVEDGLSLIEKRLMGGFIARAILRGRQWRDSVQPLGAGAVEYDQYIKPPKIYLSDRSYIKVAIHIDNYLSLRTKAEPEGREEFLETFSKKYPKIVNNFPGTMAHYMEVEGYPSPFQIS